MRTNSNVEKPNIVEQKVEKTQVREKALVTPNVEKKVEKQKLQQGAKVKNVENRTSKEEIRKPKDVVVLETPEIRNMKKVGAGRVLLAILWGMIGSGILAFIVFLLYMNYIKYPSQMEVIEENTGRYALSQWENHIDTLEEIETVFANPEDISYLSQEISYMNGNEVRENFIRNMVMSVTYTPNTVRAINKYGYEMMDRFDMPVYTLSEVRVGETVGLTYVDYSAIVLDKEKIVDLMAKHSLKLGAVDYSNLLVNVFCEYMVSIEELPLRTVMHNPNLVLQSNGKYKVSSLEDVYLDKLLFSSDDFYALLDRFSIVAAGEGLKPTTTWSNWNKKTEEEKLKESEPLKYNVKDMISKVWCGAYYLQNEYSETGDNGVDVKKPISAMVGDGTFEDPAGLDTDVVTSVLVVTTDKNGKEVVEKKPIRIRLKEFGVSESAIKWFESKDLRNRGLDVKSEVQYAYYIFEVTNLSSETITIYDNTSLADENENLSARTGTFYGLSEEVTLKPDETGIIESWSNSTELNHKYLIWGADFERKEPVVWIRVLAGDIDDPSEDKGVTLNKTRSGE